MIPAPMPPTYALDLGNTRVKFGRFEAGVLREIKAFPRAQQAAALSWLKAQPSAGYALLSGRDDEAHWRAALEPIAPVYVYAPGQPLPVTLYYDTPTTLGTDRLAAVIGARALHPRADVMVVSAGTCMTVEYLTSDGDYLGGSISPGLGMRLRAMHTFTGKLPEAPLVLPKGPPIGVSTATALQQGAIRGAGHEIAGWYDTFRRLRARGASSPSAQKPPRLLLCGGDAALLQPLSPPGAELREHLVLEGLHQLRLYALP